MSKQKLLTLEDFMSFCETYCNEHALSTFSLKELDKNTEIIVHTIETFNVSGEEESDFLPVQLKACHINLNRNNSYISEENMLKNMKTIYNRPILGKIITNDDGEYDFDQHNMEIIEDPFNEGESKFHYEEQPIGIVPESGNARLEYDEENNKTYLVVDGLIYVSYGNLAADIIKRKGGTKVSVEIAIKDMSYNAKENYLEILDFEFRGITALGEHVGEGMLGSKMTLESFNAENNSFFNKESENKLIEALDKINETLSKFNINNSEEKGGIGSMDLKELLEKYNKTEEDITFDYSEMTNEELAQKFEEEFGEEAGEPNTEPDAEPDAANEPEEPETTEDFSITCPECGAVIEDESATVCPECGASLKNDEEPEEDSEDSEDFAQKKVYSADDNTVTFALSHNEISNALWNLIAQYDEEDNKCYFVRDVYDNYFVMQDWYTGVMYKQAYTTENDSVALSGERIEVYEMLLTAEEKAAIEEMKTNYAELKQFKTDVESEQENAKKLEELNNQCYSPISETEEFKALIDNVGDYSFDEVVNKADLLLAKSVKSGTFSFAQQTEDKKQNTKIGISVPKQKKKPYGKLFDNLNK